MGNLRAMALTKPLPRMMTAVVESALRRFPAVVLTGARQTGKSTLVRSFGTLADRRYVTLDTAVNRGLAKSEPHTLLSDRSRLTVGEVQRVPELLLAVKEEIDARRMNGRFLLTGTANLLLLRKVSESLAGRACYLTLWPMTRREQLGLASCGIWEEFFSQPSQCWLELVQGQTAAEESWQSLAERGGYPSPALLHPKRQPDPDRNEIFAGYTQVYLERDLRDLAAVDSLVEFQRLMRAVCLRLGAVFNQAELARDTGLALHLSEAGEVSGAHLENLICTDLLAWRELHTTRPSIKYWRTSTGEEVDFVVEWKNRLLGFEVKATRNPGYNDAKGLRTFLKEYEKTAVGGLLLYGAARPSGFRNVCWRRPGGRWFEQTLRQITEQCRPACFPVVGVLSLRVLPGERNRRLVTLIVNAR